jgi:CheY-like chemotaxis protein
MMSEKTRTILVVEDDADLCDLYVAACEAAIATLKRDDSIHVIEAPTYHDAKKTLEHTSDIRLASIDLALRAEERGLRDTDRQDNEAGGMRLLEQIRTMNLPVLSVIVTGETLQSYATDALQKYGVVRFFDKARWQQDEYEDTLVAILYYLDTEDILSEIEQGAEDLPQLFQRAEASWEQTKKYAQRAHIERTLPHDLSTRITMLRERTRNENRLDPMTNLPSSDITAGRLKEAVVGRDHGWALLQIRLRNFKALQNSRSSQIHPIFLHITRLIQDTVNQQPRNERIFVGMLGQGAFADPCFVILMRATPVDTRQLSQIKQIKSTIAEQFDASAPSFTDQMAIRKGQQQVVPQLEIREWNCEKDFFPDFPDLVDQFFESKEDNPHA